MPDVILLCGVSGVGKTWLRTHHTKLAQYPCVDIKDVYADLPSADWYEATVSTATKARKLLRKHDTVVIEGYFLPGTESRRLLAHNLTGVEGQEIFLHASHNRCVQRIRDSEDDVERRLKLLDARWEYADCLHKERQHD